MLFSLNNNYNLVTNESQYRFGFNSVKGIVIVLEFVSFVIKEGVCAPCVRLVKSTRLWAFHSKMMLLLMVAGMFSRSTDQAHHE